MGKETILMMQSSIANAAEEKLIKERQALIRTHLSESFSRAEKYTTAIIAGGYAAFFAAWSGMSAQLPIIDKSWSLLCILWSLVTFISWEIFKMIKMGMLMKFQLEVFQAKAASFYILAQKLEKKEKSFQELNIKVWPNVLVLSIAPAVIAICFLLKGILSVLLFK